MGNRLGILRTTDNRPGGFEVDVSLESGAVLSLLLDNELFARAERFATRFGDVFANYPWLEAGLERAEGVMTAVPSDIGTLFCVRLALGGGDERYDICIPDVSVREAENAARAV